MERESDNALSMCTIVWCFCKANTYFVTEYISHVNFLLHTCINRYKHKTLFRNILLQQAARHRLFMYMYVSKSSTYVLKSAETLSRSQVANGRPSIKYEH